MRMYIGWIQRGIALVALISLSLIPLHAQVDTGSIQGIVTDSSGAVIAGATVTLTNLGTNASLSTTTGSDGSYKFDPVRIGAYKVDASSKGFETLSQTNITVDVKSDVVANFALKPGNATTVVTVTSTVPVLQTQNASVGTVVGRHEVDSLPLNGRNFTFLAQLSAGVNTPQADTRNMGLTGAFSANGSRPSQNNYLLDGIDNNSDVVDFLNGTSYVVLPPVDAIQEFKVETADFSAQYGRSGAAVLNATIKSGTNDLHGTIWEFLRNDKLDAADFFAHTTNNGVLTTTKGEQRQNQFGGSAGGPIRRDKLFFFGDVEILRRIQGEAFTGSVPTAAERSSGFTNFQDQISLQSGTKTDALGRSIPNGTILDPATTRPVTAGVVDPVTGLIAASTGFVRDPFFTASGSCPVNTTSFTLAACPTLNMLPAGRLDPNAIKLLGLYPVPNNGTGLSNNFTNSPNLIDNRESFDTRIDYDLSSKDQMFFRYSYGNEPEFFPGIYTGTPNGLIADGGNSSNANFNQTSRSQQGAAAETHIFSANLVNVARVGFSSLHTIHQQPEDLSPANIPAMFGIQGIQQTTVDGSGNGGLPNITFTGLSGLGAATFIPSNEKSDTLQVTDDLTKIWRKHTFQMGMEFQNVLFSTLQPPRSRSEFDYNSDYVDVAGQGGGVAVAEALLTPIASTVPGGATGGVSNFLGGASDARFSNIGVVHDVKQYYGVYGEDDWKVTRKLTLNLGLRWDFFGRVGERDGHQGNFLPYGGPGGAPVFIIPPGFSSILSTAFTNQLTANGITLLQTNTYGAGLGNSPYNNFAPRFGFAYQAMPKLVVRGGFGMFYNGFENRGFSPNGGLNYPFIYKQGFTPSNDESDMNQVFSPSCSYGPGATAGTATLGSVGSAATLETGFECVGSPPNPLNVTPVGLALEGIQFNYQTPYTMGGNLTMQYAVTPTLSVQAGYVTSLARHLEVFPYNNNVDQILPASPTAAQLLAATPFPQFAVSSWNSGQGDLTATQGNSYYHALQTQIQKTFSSGLTFLLTYTYSNVRSDAIDLLNQGSVSTTTYRAGGILPPQADYSQAPFDIRNVWHFSGTYDLPFGKGKRFASGAQGFENAAIGGWSIVWSGVFQGGQPVNIFCFSATAKDLGCYESVIPGMNPYGPNENQFFNAAAFTQPCILANVGGVIQSSGSPAGCIPESAGNLVAALGAGPAQLEGPDFRRLDLSGFKAFQLNERFSLQFRCEVFNVGNHPNFNAPGINGGGSTITPSLSSFGKIGSTRDNPYDAREIQFALKLYY